MFLPTVHLHSHFDIEKISQHDISPTNNEDTTFEIIITILVGWDVYDIRGSIVIHDCTKQFARDKGKSRGSNGESWMSSIERSWIRKWMLLIVNVHHC
jgi:hypothetical protein